MYPYNNEVVDVKVVLHMVGNFGDIPATVYKIYDESGKQIETVGVVEYDSEPACYLIQLKNKGTTHVILKKFVKEGIEKKIEQIIMS